MLHRLLALAALLFVAAPASSQEIRFETEDLADPVPGEDRRLYRYEVADASFLAAQGFAVRFAPDLYTDLEVLPAPSGDWDVLALAPDPLLPDFGSLDARALVDDPDAAGTFEVHFNWHGEGEPGPQPFVLYDADFLSLAEGTTVAVPEPGAAGLGVLLAAGLALRRARRRAGVRALGSPRLARRAAGRAGFGLLVATSLGAEVPASTLEPVVHEFVLQDFSLGVSLAAKRRTGRTEVQYRYRGELENTGTFDATEVVVRVTSGSEATRIVDDLLVFGDVGEGTSAQSADTFSFEHDRTVPFDPAVFSFSVEQDAIPDIPFWAGTLDTAGGLVDARLGRALLEVPPGALPASTEIRVTPLTSGFDRTQVLPSSAYDFGPDGLVFDPPARVTLTYDEVELPEGLPEDETGLSIAKFVGDDLVELPDNVVDPVNNTVSAPLGGFSSVVVVLNCSITRADGSSICGPPASAPDDPGGDLDPSFGVGGKAVFDLGSILDSVNAVALQADGSEEQILLAGDNPRLAVARIQPDGEGFDPTFGSAGITTVSVQADAVAQAITVQPDGRILVAGPSNELPPETGLDLAIIRLTEDGALDPSFADSGILLEERNAVSAGSIQLLPDGRILVVTTDGLYQYTRNGAPDSSFGVDGIYARSVVMDARRRASGFWAVLNRVSFRDEVRMELVSDTGDFVFRGTSPDFSDTPWPQEIAETATGSYVVAGELGSSPFSSFHDVFIARFGRSDLEPSTLFGGPDGKTEVDFGGNDRVFAIARQPDARYVVVGSTEGPGGDTDFLVARFRSDGFPDAGFGDGGKLLVDFGGDDVARDVVIDRAGRILVVGETKVGSNTDAALVRILP